MGRQETGVDSTDHSASHPRGGTPPQAASRAAAGIGEEELVARILAICTPSRDNPTVIVGPGDDAAVIESPDARTVMSTDLLIEGRHFRRDWSEPADIGLRAAAANFADVAAMGAQPTALVIGLGIPPDIDPSWVEALMRGVMAEAQRAGAAVVGGDVVAADQLTISGTAVGDLQGRDPILRSGAVSGDVVATAGRLGWAAAGLAVLSRGFRSPRALVDAHRRPEPPYDLARMAAQSGAHALMDVSDGLLLDLDRMARASEVRINLDSHSIEIADPIAAAAAAYNLHPLQWVLGGGDDHAFVATFASGAKIPAGWHIIGQVFSEDADVYDADADADAARANRKDSPAPRVTVDGKASDFAPGFTHFTR